MIRHDPKAQPAPQPRKRFTLPDGPRGDAPQTRSADMARANRYKHTSPDFYRARVDASQHHPEVQAAQQRVQEAPASQKRKALRGLEKVKEAHRRNSDPLAMEHYTRFLKTLYTRAEPYFGPTQPAAVFGKGPANVAAYVTQGDKNTVHYQRGTVRDFMLPLSNSIRREYAETVPLHEWVHTRQPPSDLPSAQLEGQAEIGRAVLSQRLAMNAPAIGGQYDAWMTDEANKRDGVPRLLAMLAANRR